MSGRLKALNTAVISKTHGAHLSFEQSLFLLTVYHTELLLMPGGKIHRIYSYCSTTKDGSLSPVLHGLANTVCACYAPIHLQIIDQFIERYRHDYRSNALVAEHVNNVIGKYLGPSRVLSDLILTHLCKVFGALPFVIWNTTTIKLMLDMAQVLAQACRDEMLQRVRLGALI
jgi:hypothetical protein